MNSDPPPKSNNPQKSGQPTSLRLELQNTTLAPIPSLKELQTLTAFAYLCLLGGTNQPQDVDLAIDLFQKCADKEFGPAYLALSRIYVYQKDYYSNLMHLISMKKAADLGMAEAQFNYGLANYLGRDGLDINKAFGLEFLEKAVANGWLEAYVKLGFIYLNGDGTPKRDVDRGLKLVREGLAMDIDVELFDFQGLLDHDVVFQINLSEVLNNVRDQRITVIKGATFLLAKYLCEKNAPGDREEAVDLIINCVELYNDYSMIRDFNNLIKLFNLKI
ncbi:MAG: hypothetical protein LBI10_13230 [Deltaproteobacteria bacterium]|jgi:hypothetical protein|nr:hypothetical protein [Deltaproteobacteria bacterium]